MGYQLAGGNQASGDYWWSFTTATPIFPKLHHYRYG